MSKARRPGRRASSAERWELAAMKAAGVLKHQDHPDFDEDGNVSQLAPSPSLPLPCHDGPPLESVLSTSG